MVAGALIALGIDLGSELPVNIEDPFFNIDGKRNKRAQFIETMKRTIQDRLSTKRVWGWKYPQAVEYLEEIKSDIPNPYFVIVYRDPVPATIRECRGKTGSGQIDAVAYREMDKSIRLARLNLDIARKWKCPTLLVSYERASLNPEEFLQELSDFSGMPVPADTSKILEFMKPGEYKSPEILRGV
jgi:hypothetical protein